MTQPPVVVCDDVSELAQATEALVEQRWYRRRGFDVPDEPWDLGPQRFCCEGLVDDEPTAAAATLALARGCALVVTVGADVPDTFAEDLARAGTVRYHRAAIAGPLSTDEDRLLTLLASGRSVAQAADELFWSTRTTQRRLASARTALGVSTTRQAVIAWSGLRADDR